MEMRLCLIYVLYLLFLFLNRHHDLLYNKETPSRIDTKVGGGGETPFQRQAVKSLTSRRTWSRMSRNLF